MGHIVVFEGSDQVSTYQRCEDLAEAVSFAEKLRNDRGVDKLQIFRTEEVRFDFRPYYRVELGAAAPAPAPVETEPLPAPPFAMAPIAPPSAVNGYPDEQPSPTDLPEFDDDLSVGSGVRRGLFGR